MLPREFALLMYLASRPGQVVSRTEIESHIYDDRAELMSNVVDSAICALRRKNRPAGPAIIHRHAPAAGVRAGDRHGRATVAGQKSLRSRKGPKSLRPDGSNSLLKMPTAEAAARNK